MRRLLAALPFALLLSACSDDQARPAGSTFASATVSGTDATSVSSTSSEEESSTDPTTTTTATSATTTTTTTGDPPELPCDPDFAFTPDPPGTGALLNVAFTDLEPLAYVDLLAEGPGVAAIGWAGITTNDPWTWNWTVTDLSPGVWTFTFGAGEPWAALASCQVEVLDTGLPQPLPTGSCDDKICGEDDGQGGTCETCPMVGDCLDPPSPYNPNGPGEWSCLDNASCNPDSGTCRIWCPGEPCNNEAHPDGCPQGVETCFVDASFASYEDACRACCESRYHQPTGEYACWDEAYNLCRYPTDCGLPLW